MVARDVLFSQISHRHAARAPARMCLPRGLLYDASDCCTIGVWQKGQPLDGVGCKKAENRGVQTHTRCFALYPLICGQRRLTYMPCGLFYFPTPRVQRPSDAKSTANRNKQMARVILEGSIKAVVANGIKPGGGAEVLDAEEDATIPQGTARKKATEVSFAPAVPDRRPEAHRVSKEEFRLASAFVRRFPKAASAAHAAIFGEEHVHFTAQRAMWQVWKHPTDRSPCNIISPPPPPPDLSYSRLFFSV